ncbi:MAG: very short patch repair endonuclease [Streptosporangiaceae bacterium]
MGRQWREQSLDDSAWRPARGLSRADRAAEQDQAAGSREQRTVAGTPGLVLASIYFRRSTGRRVYAYLRWADAGRTSERFVCEVEHETRADNLAYAWQVARDRELLTVNADEHRQESPRPVPPSWASSEVVRKQMQANRSRDTRPELALRSRVHELGLRYRVAARPLPSVRRTADLVFTRARVAVFMDGCFWHGCPDHHRPSQRNEQFWREKIARNRDRDAETDKLLQDAGWTVVRIWEHEQPELAALRIRETVSTKRNSLRSREP